MDNVLIANGFFNHSLQIWERKAGLFVGIKFGSLQGPGKGSCSLAAGLSPFLPSTGLSSLVQRSGHLCGGEDGAHQHLRGQDQTWSWSKHCSPNPNALPKHVGAQDSS